MEKLTVYPEHMLRNLNLTGGLIHSQQVLLALAQAGLSREDAYRIVQRNAMAHLEGGGSFKERLAADEDIKAALGDKTQEVLDGLFDPRNFLTNLDHIFSKVFG